MNGRVNGGGTEHRPGSFGLRLASGLIGATFAAASPTVLAGQVPGAAESVTIAEITGEITVDGRLDDPGWIGAVPIELPYEIRPGENRPARVRTVCRAAFDRETLYFGCHAYDRPDAVRAYLSDRDRINAHDRVVVFLDPYADARRAFFFNVNPLGVQQDGILNGLDGQADLRWDALWSSAGRLTDDGYVVEMAIPFRTLRFPPSGSGRPWRFFIERNWPRNDVVVFRSTRLDPSNACNLCQSDELVGVVGVEPGRGAVLTPTLTSGRTDRLDAFPGGSLEPGSVESSVGVTGKLRITDDLSLNATVNPDFSQVEADVAQLDVNTQFSLFFPEKRPFFLDGTEVLATDLRGAFTRSFADPSVGASLTGKLGPTLLASLVARDEETNVLVPGNQSSQTVVLDGSSTGVVQRVRTDIGGTGTVGALYTGRFGEGYRNQVGGADAFVRLSPLVRASAQVLGSWTRDPDAIVSVGPTGRVRQTGNAGRVLLRRSDWGTRRSWFGSLQAEWRSPDFRADAGFEPQVDVRRIDFDAAWNTWSDGAPWFTRLNYWIGGHHSETFDGRLNSEEIWVWFSYNGPRQTFFWVWPRWGRQFFDDQVFSTSFWEFSLSTQPGDDVSFGVNLTVGDQIDFANARQGAVTRLSPNLTVRLGQRIDLDLQHRFERVEAAGSRVFTANLTQLRTVYSFSPRAFVRAIAQFRHTDRDPSLYRAAVDRTSRGLFTQFLVSYRVDAQTGVFLGYSDNHRGLTPEDDPRVPLTRTDRTVFLKLSYAWQPS